MKKHHIHILIDKNLILKARIKVLKKFLTITEYITELIKKDLKVKK